MSDEPLFRGVGVALITVFTEDGAPDVDATAAHARRLVDLGVRAVLVAGTTGEASRLDRPARTALVDAVRSALPVGVPVLAGTGAAASAQAAELTRDAVAAGADAVLCYPPAGESLTDAFRTVHSACAGRPLLGYHYPTVLPAGIPVDDLLTLPLAGVKDSSGDAARLLDTIDRFPGAVYTGAAPLALLAGAMGATGALLAVANALPEECALAFEGDAGAQRRVFAAHREVAHDSPRAVVTLTASRFALRERSASH